MSKEGCIKIGGLTFGSRDAQRPPLAGDWTPDDLVTAASIYEAALVRARESNAVVDGARAVLRAASGGKNVLKLGPHAYSISDAAWVGAPTASEAVDRYEVALGAFGRAAAPATDAWARLEGIEKALLRGNDGVSVIIAPASAEREGGVFGIYDRRWVGPRTSYTAPGAAPAEAKRPNKHQ